MSKAPIADVSQFSFPALCAVTAAVEALAQAERGDEHGAIFTRREVVDFILDLTGYRSNLALHSRRALEPSFGRGDFLLPMVERLIAAWKSHQGSDALADLSDSIRAVELHEATYAATRARLIEFLESKALSSAIAEKLANCWLIHGDFLLTPLAKAFDYVVGNPPYVRQELIPDELLREYRSRFRTIYDRADLYIPFIERCLSLLSSEGQLGFICADRWMKNRYGRPLRQFISESFHLKIYVDMTGTSAFHSEVSAYPAITIFERGRGHATRIARQPTITREALEQLAGELLDSEYKGELTVQINSVDSGSEPWILDTDERLALVRRLEECYPTLEKAGCKVGIGVATGADKAFIGHFDELDVEDDRKLPLVMTRDILGGQVEWRGLGVVNPFDSEGGLVKLEMYPRLRRYLEARRDQIAGRHVAQKAPRNWYRTIDRIHADLASKPKLLIPDIKGDAHIVLERGKLYPHHNLYYILSAEWDLEALQGVLMSGIARLFVGSYSTKMRGGYLRFQAQYLRRIRVPHWSQVNETCRQNLKAAVRAKDIALCNATVEKLYELSPPECLLLQESMKYAP